MRRYKDKDGMPSTAKAVGFGMLAVGGFWLLFGAVTVAIMHPVLTATIAQQLPPPDPNGRAIDASQPIDHVTYGHFAFVPLGRPVTLDNAKIGFLGQTSEGYGLWTEKPAGGAKVRIGGGGGPSVPRALPDATGPVYLRTSDGRWWQVIQRK